MFAASKTASVSGGYQISRSLRFNSPDSAYLSRTLTTPTSNTTWSWSGWVKLGQLGTTRQLFGGAGANYGSFGFETTDQIRFWNNAGAAAATSTAVYRDPSAWYHVVVISNGTTIKAYVNNSEVLSYTGTITNINSAIAHQIGRFGGLSYYADGYMTEVYFIDGQALTPSSFGETNAQTGVWQPKAYSGSYGTNGFYLNFSDNSNTTAATLGKDYSGNGNNWTPNNFSVTAGAGNDSLVDTPTAYGTDTGVGGTVRGNYCTWNPIGSVLGAGSATNGNLDVACADSTTGAAGSRGTMATTSGQWYFEVLVASGGLYSMIGVSDTNKVITSAGWGSVNAWCYYGNTGSKYGNGADAAYGATYTTGDLIGVAYDSDAGTLTFYKNGTSQGQAFSGLTGKAFAPYVGTASGTMTFTLNAGQRPFAYTAPSGYKALCTQNLPTPTIGATTATQAGKYFGVLTYTGNGSATQAITGLNFQPDFSWVKNRSNVAWYAVVDAVRTTAVQLDTTTTTDESNSINVKANYGGLSSFDSGGITVSSGSDGTYKVTNGSGQTYVAWNWKANGSGSSNTAGSITSTVSANTTSGFSVVTYAGNSTLGATIGHGLGVAPSMIIVKSRSATTNWVVYHASIGNTKAIFLNLTNATDTDNYWNNTSPTSSVFSVNASTGLNSSGSNYVAYCFAEVSGYSKFGSWTGNGSSDGVFVYCGFKPAYVLMKGTNSNGYIWTVYDSKRNTYNVANLFLEPDSSGAETTFTTLDFLSNGFKIRSSDSAFNASGSTYIFAAFAESPFKYSLAR